MFGNKNKNSRYFTCITNVSGRSLCLKEILNTLDNITKYLEKIDKIKGRKNEILYIQNLYKSLFF